METFRLSDFYDLVGFADPSSGKLLSSGGCENAIVIVGQLEDGRAFVLDEWGARASSDELIRRMFEYNRRWHCKRFGLESSGQQNLFFQQVAKEVTLSREPMCLVPVEQPTTQTKEYRVTVTIQHWMHNGFLFMNDNCTQLYKQLERYPAQRLVDRVDALASALRLLHDPLASRSKVSYNSDDVDYHRRPREVRTNISYSSGRR